MILEEMKRIDREIEIQATPERVWRALTNSSELSAWFQVAIEGEIGPGKSVWMTSKHAGYEGHRFRVEFVEMTPPQRFVWKWQPGEVDPKVDYSREAQTTVTFTLEPSVSGTRLSVAETGFDAVSLERRAKVYTDNSQGWTEVVGWLKSYAETSS